MSAVISGLGIASGGGVQQAARELPNLLERIIDSGTFPGGPEILSNPVPMIIMVFAQNPSVLGDPTVASQLDSIFSKMRMDRAEQGTLGESVFAMSRILARFQHQGTDPQMALEKMMVDANQLGGGEKPSDFGKAQMLMQKCMTMFKTIASMASQQSKAASKGIKKI